MQSITNAEIYKMAYRQLAVSDFYLPLTHLSKSVLIQAQGILGDLLDLVKEIEVLRTKLTTGNNVSKVLEKHEQIVKLSNRYYELIPRATSKWEPVQPLAYLAHV